MKSFLSILILSALIGVAGCAVTHAQSPMAHWRPIRLSHIRPDRELITRISSALRPIIEELNEAYKGDAAESNLTPYYSVGNCDVYKENGASSDLWIFASLNEYGVDGANRTARTALLWEHHGNLLVVRRIADGDLMDTDAMTPQLTWNQVTHQRVLAFYVWMTRHGGAGASSFFVTEISRSSKQCDVLARVDFPEHDPQFTKVRIAAEWDPGKENFIVQVPSNMVPKHYWRTDLPIISIKSPQVGYRARAGLSFVLSVLLKNDVTVIKQGVTNLIMEPQRSFSEK